MVVPLASIPTVTAAWSSSPVKADHRAAPCPTNPWPAPAHRRCLSDSLTDPFHELLRNPPPRHRRRSRSRCRCAGCRTGRPAGGFLHRGERLFHVLHIVAASNGHETRQQHGTRGARGHATKRSAGSVMRLALTGNYPRHCLLIKDSRSRGQRLSRTTKVASPAITTDSTSGPIGWQNHGARLPSLLP